jgi:hypothetical protein
MGGKTRRMARTAVILYRQRHDSERDAKEDGENEGLAESI